MHGWMENTDPAKVNVYANDMYSPMEESEWDRVDRLHGKATVTYPWIANPQLGDRMAEPGGKEKEPEVVTVRLPHGVKLPMPDKFTGRGQVARTWFSSVESYFMCYGVTDDVQRIAVAFSLIKWGCGEVVG